MMFYALFAVLGLFFGTLVSYLVLGRKNTTLQERLKFYTETNVAQETELKELREKLIETSKYGMKWQTEHALLEEKLANQKTALEELQYNNRIQFENIAGKILEEKTEKFTKNNHSNLESILKPLGDEIARFKKQVEEVYDKESRERFSLERTVKELSEKSNLVSEQANNLATALKGQAKTQGNWGEMILETLLQSAGLMNGVGYFIQHSAVNDDGERLQPDIVVNLPDNKVVVIDSKVSLVAYDRFFAADKKEDRENFLREHISSIRKHIDSLSSKKYHNAVGNSLDFTIMFIPIEPAYIVSVQNDEKLWLDAYSKGILLVSPTNMMACLRLINELWKREKMNKNAQEISKRGQYFYDKFVLFLETLQDVEKNIDRSKVAYEKAVNQLKSGKGNLIGQAMKLQELGVRGNKDVPANFIPIEFEDEEG